MKVRLRYYALLAEQAGVSAEELESSARDLAALYVELRARHGFTLAQGSIRPALNDEFCAWETPLTEGASIVFIPPVSGG